MPEAVFISLHHLVAASWRRRYLLITPILIMPLIGLSIGLLSPRQWETHTTVLIQETAKLNPFLEDLSVSTNLEGRIAALKSLLHSRHILLGVANDLGMLPTNASNAENDNIVKKLSSALSVKLVGSDLVKFSYKSNSPDNIAQTLSVVRERFLNNLLAPERSSINASENFLQDQLNKNRDSLRSAESKLAEFKREHASELPNLHAGNVARLRQLNDMLSERETSLAGARAAKYPISASGSDCCANGRTNCHP
jgi:uncharacterized protein involved in exopolysaccharide biosynthesis